MLCRAGCGAPVVDAGFCGPCRVSLGLGPLPAPVRKAWSAKEREGFREREARGAELQARIAALPEPEDGDPFVGANGQDLGVGMRNTGAGGIR